MTHALDARFYLASSARLMKRQLLKIVHWINLLRFRIFAAEDNFFLELGSGPKRGKGNWITLDESPGCDVIWDLRRGLPFRDSTARVIYSSHLLEHIPVSSQSSFLKECLRVLKPGGEFSICVPNARLFIQAYVSGYYFERPIDSVNKFWPETSSLIDQVNYVAYMGGLHNCLFDEENLVNLLERNGFVRVSLRSFDPNLDILERDRNSIYAIGYKAHG
jgi:predicted SAM-dependent methyltransferase